MGIVALWGGLGRSVMFAVVMFVVVMFAVRHVQSPVDDRLG